MPRSPERCSRRRRSDSGAALVEVLVALLLVGLALLLAGEVVVIQPRALLRLRASEEALSAIEATVESLRAGALPLEDAHFASPGSRAAADLALDLRVEPAARVDLFHITVVSSYRVWGDARARRIETPPYYAYPVRPGITFTYLGTRVNKQARMLMKDGKPAANMFAAGEIMAGNVLGKGYAAGMGMTIGSVFGRIAGREAAQNARN